jgi:hypothetical protein
MKKSILFLALIASIFVACEPQPRGVAKEEIYGTWVCENNGSIDWTETDAIPEDLLFIINEQNTTFILDDSIAIRHSYWEYTEDSDLGYMTYRYELTKEKKLILTTHNEFSGKDSFFEFTKRPDLDPVVEHFIADGIKDNGGLIDTKGFLGKWEWVATENLDSSNTVFAKHVMDTLENAVFEFVPNTAILFYDGSIVNNNRRLSLYSMPPYRVIMSNKEKGIIADWAVAEFANGLSQMLFRFPIYNKNNELMGYYHFGGSHYFYSSLEKGKMVLSDRYSDTKITFKRIE